jgi:hypothetical protein
MPVKITTKLTLKQLPDKISKRFAKDIKQDIVKIITDEILSGKSPVKNKGSFKDYSLSYKETIKGNVSFRRLGGSTKATPLPFEDKNITKHGKSVSPVNMKLSGDMLKSLTAKQNAKGQVIISFKSKIAKFHDKLGAGKSKVIRRLLPNNSDKGFNPKIMAKLMAVLRRAVKKSL